MCSKIKRKHRKEKVHAKVKYGEAETLLYEPLEKPSFVVDGLIPTGL